MVPAQPPTRAMRARSSASASPTPAASASRKTKRKVRSGCAWRPIRAKCMRNSNSALRITWRTGVARDEGESFKWFRLSALQGFADAQVTLALKYDQGSGVAEDRTHASMWYRLAAMEGDDDAPYLLSEIELRMTPEQIAQAKDMAARCKTSGYKDCD